jgi:branched-chain amino acid transport system substrate-binding protein
MPAVAQEPVKIGFVATFSGPAAVIGTDMRDAFELALDNLGRKFGDRPVNVIYEDDQQKPEAGKLKTDKLIEADKVNFITGYIWSNVLLASLKGVVDSQTFLISANAGPSQIAGELCSPWFFSVSWQGDQVPQAIGEYLTQKKIKSAYSIAPNYAAGKDVVAGLKATYRGELKGEDSRAGPTSSTSRLSCQKRARAPRKRSLPSIPAPPACNFSRNIRKPASKGRSRSTRPS